VNCREFTEVAAAWLDGEAPPEKRAAIGEHLAGCDECARLLEDLAAVDRAVKEQPAAERAESDWEDFNRKLMVRIAMDGRAKRAPGAKRSSRVLRWSARLAAAAAALVVAGWVGFSLKDKAPVESSHTIPDGGLDLRGLSSPDDLASELGLPAGIEIDVAPDTEENRAQLDRLLSAAERVLVRLKNADPTDREELAAIRSAVIDNGLVTRLSEARGTVGEAEPISKAARPVEMLLRRVSNGRPDEAEEFAAIQSAVVDNAVVEHTRMMRAKR